MSTTSPREQAAADTARYQAELSQQLWGVAKPGLTSILDILTKESAGGYQALSPLVERQFGAARSELESSFDRAQFTQKELIAQRARTSGQPYSTMELDSAITQAGSILERDRKLAERNLEFQRASAGLNQYNTLMALLGQGAQQALGYGQGWGTAQSNAIAGLSNASQFGNTMSGAVSGAATGASIGSAFPGYGTVIGGIVGGIGGGIAGYNS